MESEGGTESRRARHRLENFAKGGEELFFALASIAKDRATIVSIRKKTPP